MQIHTSRFGAVEIRPDDELLFPLGLIGLEAWRRWVVLADSRTPGLGWLQSIERDDLALAVVSPRRFVPEYQVRVAASELSPLEAAGETPQVVVAVSCHGGEALSINLKAPILICLGSRRGRQVVAKDEHAVRHWLNDPAELRRSA